VLHGPQNYFKDRLFQQKQTIPSVLPRWETMKKKDTQKQSISPTKKQEQREKEMKRYHKKKML